MRIPLAAAGLLLAGTAAAQTPIRLDTIVVSPERSPTEAARTGATVDLLTEQEIESEPFLLESLDRVPGLTVAQSGPPGAVSDLFLRGLPQRYVRVRIEGIEISDPTAPQVAPSVSGLLAGGFERVEVLKGSHSALYGGQAVAGVIDIASERPEVDGVENRLTLEAGSYDTQRGAWSLARRTERSDVAVTLQRFQTDGFSAAEEADGNEEEDGYETTRLSASGSFYPSDSVRLFASGFWQDEEGEQDGFPPPDFLTLADTEDTFETETWGARAGAEFPLGPVESTLAASIFDIDRRVFTGDGALSFGGEGDRRVLEYLGRLAVNPALDLQLGADYTHEEATFLPSDLTVDSSIAGAFATATWVPFDPLSLSLSLRQDEHSEFGGYTTGRATAAYRLPTETILRASVGTGFRAPSLNELFGQFGANPDLEPETSFSVDLGVEQPLLDGRARVSATAFLIEIDDLIEYDFLAGYFQSDGTARSKGVELAASWQATDRVTLAAAYTYTDAEQADGNRRPRVPRHEAVLTADAQLTDRLSFGATVRHVADVVDVAGAPGSEDLFGDYTLVGARAGFAVTDAVELYLRGENLLDEEYQTVRGYGTADRSAYFGLTARF